MFTKFAISPGRVGVKYTSFKFSCFLEPGIYNIFDPFKKVNIVTVYIGKYREIVANQTIWTKENLEVKISYYVTYSVKDIEKYIAEYDLFSYQTAFVLTQQDIHLQSQVVLRDHVSRFGLNEVMKLKAELEANLFRDLVDVFESKGVEIHEIVIRDISMKSDLTNLYSEEYMVEKKAQLALASARSQVASSRALVNAAKILDENSNIKYIKLLETLEKVSSKTGNTIHIHLDSESD